MYIADWDGRIRILDVQTGDVRTVIEGLSIPQGLTFLDGRLYVAEMGNGCQLMWEFLEFLDGERRIQSCIFANSKEGYYAENLKNFLSRSNAQIISYHVHESGNLSDRQVVVDHILSQGRDHSPNGLTNDGEYVYASIGHPQQDLGRDVVRIADELEAEGRRTDLMGVIARFRPSDGELEVLATGLRNVYGISIAPDGTIYGADNDVQDGLATEGHREELNAIVAGGFYGFPQWGTHEAPPEANVIEPVAVLQGTGSTMAYANDDGVYVAYTSLGENNDDMVVVDRFDYETFEPTRIFKQNVAYVTAILEREGLLYLVSITGHVHVIDPNEAPITSQT